MSNVGSIEKKIEVVDIQSSIASHMRNSEKLPNDRTAANILDIDTMFKDFGAVYDSRIDTRTNLNQDAHNLSSTIGPLNIQEQPSFKETAMTTPGDGINKILRVKS